MFDEPDQPSEERSLDPADRAREKSEEFRMYAELAAVFEGPRKFDAQILTLEPDLAREIQRAVGRLDKSKTAGTPVLPQTSAADAADLLNLHRTRDRSTSDYHIHRRPGEVMIVRWIEGDQVQSFYERFQAHFDTALSDYRDEERQTHGWKQDAKTAAYLAALDGIDLKMSDGYLRDAIRQHRLFVLSTLTTDELNIAYLCDYVMNTPAAEIVGDASAPPDDPTEQDLSWFFKLFSLRGFKDGFEQMCFFAYLQKTDEAFE